MSGQCVLCGDAVDDDCEVLKSGELLHRHCWDVSLATFLEPKNRDFTTEQIRALAKARVVADREKGRREMRELAVMRGVGFGTRGDGRGVYLYFGAYTGDGVGSLQMISADEALVLLSERNISDVKDLEGAACWVRSDGIRVHFDGLR